jgi:hypothetical protein
VKFGSCLVFDGHDPQRRNLVDPRALAQPPCILLDDRNVVLAIRRRSNVDRSRPGIEVVLGVIARRPKDRGRVLEEFVDIFVG